MSLLPNKMQQIPNMSLCTSIYRTAKPYATITWYEFMLINIPYCQTKCNNYLIWVYAHQYTLLSNQMQQLPDMSLCSSIYPTVKPNVTITWYEFMLNNIPYCQTKCNDSLIWVYVHQYSILPNQMQQLPDMSLCSSIYPTAKPNATITWYEFMLINIPHCQTKRNTYLIWGHDWQFNLLPNQMHQLPDLRLCSSIYPTAKPNATITWYEFMLINIPYCKTKCNNYLIWVYAHHYTLLPNQMQQLPDMSLCSSIYLIAKPSATLNWFEVMIDNLTYCQTKCINYLIWGYGRKFTLLPN